MIDNHTNSESLPELSKTFTVTKFLDQFPTYLRELIGTNNVSFSYVIRETVDVPPILPVLIMLKTWSLPHQNMMEELISYSPHDGPAFESYNARA